MVAAEYIVNPTRVQGPDHYDVSLHPSDSNGSRNYPWRAGSVVLLLASQLVCAGEISGLPPHMAPTVRPDYSFYLGNDFAAAGTSDDFRTEQMIITGRLGDSWVAVVDHSIFTREDVPEPERGRIDLMTVSLGYEFLNVVKTGRRSSMTAGLGVRGVGNYEGERIQNGFHRLIESDTSAIPYTDTRRTAPVAWLLVEHRQRLRPAGTGGFPSNWDISYWARAGTLATTDGQFDAVAGLYLVASRRLWDVWLGLRRDWRSGYDGDPVLRDAAAEEEKTAVSVGFRFGALVVETVQRLDSAASYGQISFVSAPNTRSQHQGKPVRADAQFTLQMPHITFQLAGRWHRRIVTKNDSRWSEAIFMELRGGQPQLGRDPTRFVETTQVGVGLEWSRSLFDALPWLRSYTSAGFGVRREKLLGREQLAGLESEAIDRAVAIAETGLEFDATRLSDHMRLKLRAGITGWYPFDDATVSIGGAPSELQRPGASIAIGWVLAWH
jgi:hypothetical protein